MLCSIGYNKVIEISVESSSDEEDITPSIGSIHAFEETSTENYSSQQENYRKRTQNFSH